MVDFFVIICDLVQIIVKGSLFPYKTGFGAFPALYQDQGDRPVFLMPQQTQPLRLQLMTHSGSKNFGQSFRLVYKIKISTEF